LKIVFLDIHGVLLTERHRVPDESALWGRELDPAAVANLRRILEDTGARIIITSSFRQGRTLSDLQRAFVKSGLAPFVIGLTPVLRDGTRAAEIQTYIDDVKDSPSVVEEFVIVDDMPSMGPLHSQFVQTEPWQGITDETYRQTMALLGSAQARPGPSQDLS